MGLRIPIYPLTYHPSNYIYRNQEMSDKSRYRLQHRGLRPRNPPRPTAQGTPSPVNPLAYGIQGHTAYGTGDSVPRKPPGLRHSGSYSLRHIFFILFTLFILSFFFTYLSIYFSLLVILFLFLYTYTLIYTFFITLFF
jgi:hypothetical protein